MPALLRAPLLHFLLLGGLLFAAGRVWRPAPAVMMAPIVVDAATIDQLHDDWRRESARAPTGAELRASVERYVDEELLLAEALRLGLDATDPVARERLLRNMRFAFPQRRAAAATLLHEARALGMSRSDRIVRRRLIQVMERRLAAALPYDEPALRAYIAQHAPRHAFRQLYFSGAVPPPVLRQLAASGAPPADAGEPFLLGAQIPLSTQTELAQRFGAEFAAALAQAPQGQWVGPLRSVYGQHLVRVEARTRARAPDFAQLREQALHAWLAEQQPQQLRLALQRLRQRQAVVLADDPRLRSGA